MTSAQAEATLHALEQKKQAIENLMEGIAALQGAFQTFFQAHKEIYRLDLAGVEDMRAGLEAALESIKSGILIPGAPPPSRRGSFGGN